MQISTDDETGWSRSDFAYELPEEQIAQHPPEDRAGGRMLELAPDAQCRDRVVRDFPDMLGPDDLLVFNDTRVIRARLRGEKSGTGGRVEVLIERVTGQRCADAQLRASKSPPPDTQLVFANGALPAVVVGRKDDLFTLRFETDDLLAALDVHGEVPLPPYVQRTADSDDAARYQTVFAREPGAVAAPTAGLHFDDAMIEAVAARGVRTAHVTLHVGLGTFQPMRTNSLREHVMHAERVRVPADVCDAIGAARARGGRVVAVGTTVVRSLEAAAAQPGGLAPFDGETRLFITPGYRFAAVDAMLTNFHLPESTLLMLVCAFGGYEPVMHAYRHAVAQGYRFFSYGDAMWLPAPAAVPA